MQRELEGKKKGLTSAYLLMFFKGVVFLSPHKEKGGCLCGYFPHYYTYPV